MTLSMYQASIPLFVEGLKNLSALLTKAEAYATEKKIDAAVLINDRIYPDMFPLSRQVQIACDIVKGGAARLAGLEVPSMPDTETSFAELQTRIQKTLAFIQTATAEQIDGSEDKPVTIKTGGKEVTLKGQDYLFRFVLPNLHFHTSIAYAILRHNGVVIGKIDFLGAIA